MKHNEVNAKVRAGPRSRSQRKNPQPMVQTTQESAYKDGVEPENEASASENCFLHG